MWTYGIAMASLKKKEKKRNMSSAFYMAIWENHSLLWKRWTIAIIHQILASKKSVVPVNGCPEPWITCKRKLRQGDGDPMSPYLFVPTADTLTSIFKSIQMTVLHSVEDNTPCRAQCCKIGRRPFLLSNGVKIFVFLEEQYNWSESAYIIRLT
jgi:hypothetical protein